MPIKQDKLPKNRQKLRVLILSKDFSAQGGIVSFVASLMENLSSTIEFDHLSIGRNSSNRVWNLLFPLIDNIRLGRRILSTKYTCVHINPSMNAKAVLRDGLTLVTLKILFYRRIIVFFHGWEDPFAAKIRKNFLWRVLFQKIFGSAPLILVLATRFRNEMIDIGIKPDQVRVISTMFDGRIFSGIQRFDNPKRSVIFLSRFIPEKGVYELLEAFEKIRRTFQDLKLVLAGDGPELDRMVQWVDSHGLNDRIIFTGYLRGKAKAQALLNADLFVFPTYHGEGCPVSLLEAMAAGLPVVTTRAGGIPDVFEDKKNGILLSEVSPAAITQAIVKLLSDQELKSHIRANNLERAWKEFEAQQVAQKIGYIYKHLAREI